MKNVQKLVSFVLAMILCLGAFCNPNVLAEKKEKADKVEKEVLKFNEDGKFKIMQMSDFQDYINDEKPEVNPRSIELMEKAIAQENPDLVVMTGDQIGGNMNAEQLEDFITQMVAPLEEAKVPWIITYGNHDEDAEDALADGWNKIKQLDFYMSFEYNYNQPTMSGCEKFEENGVNTIAVGDMYELIYDNAGEKPIYNIWALDSNRYSPIGGYDIIHADQVNWFYKTSQELEKEYGELNSLMFYHIPVPEFKFIYENALAMDVEGVAYEGVSSPIMNSGLFTAAKELGSVRGMFVGHDHVNDFVGDALGIKLGYDANVGFETYGLGGENNHKMRGVRIFELDVEDLTTFETEMLYASELGIDVSNK